MSSGSPRSGSPPGSAAPGPRSRTRSASSTCDPAVQAAIAEGRITEGHARAIGGLPAEHQEQILATVIDQALSVRQTEELVAPIARAPPGPGDRAVARAGAIRISSASRRSSGVRSAPRSAWPLAPRRPDRDRVLQRRRARPPLRAPDRRNCVTEPALGQRAPRRHGTGGQAPQPAGSGADYTAASIQVLEGLEAVRRRPGMYIGSTDVARPPPPRLGGRRQLDRRGDGGSRDARSSHDQRDGIVTVSDDGRGVPVGTALDRQGRAGGRPHGPPRGRQVRRRRLQGVRRPARRRASASSTRCPSGCASSPPRDGIVCARSTCAASRATPVAKIGPAGGRATGPRRASSPTRRSSRRSTTRSTRSASGSASWPT